MYILTEYAWYILDTPAPAYTPFWEHFLSPKRVAQMVVSTALDRPADRPERFLETFTNKVDPFGHTYQEEDLDNAVGAFIRALECLRNADIQPRYPRYMKSFLLIPSMTRL